MNFIVPLVSAVASFAFTVTILNHFFARRKLYQLIWAVDLCMHFIATGSVFWRHRLMRRQAFSNILVALGAIVSALGGILARFEALSSTAHAIFILLGVVIIFIGFCETERGAGSLVFPDSRVR